MKKFTFLLSLLFTVASLHAQDYQISFAGSGASTTVDNVIIENQTQGKSISLLGSETLHLMAIVTGNAPVLDNVDFPLHIYPNPSSDYFTIEFGARKSDPVTIKLFDLIGREIANLKQTLSSGIQSFRVSGLNYGIYTIKVDQSYYGKLISQSSSNTQITINYLGNKGVVQETTNLKNATTEHLWQYNTGDILVFTGSSGNLSAVIMEVPTKSKILTFNFTDSLPTDTLCPLPIRHAYIRVGSGTFDEAIATEHEILLDGLYVENEVIPINSPSLSGYNNLFISIPIDRNLEIWDDLGFIGTFSKLGIYDVRTCCYKNNIYRDSESFATTKQISLYIKIVKKP